MKKKQSSASTFRLNDEDRQLLATIRQHYGLTSDIAAMRLALRETVRAIKKQQSPPQASGNKKETQNS